MMASVPMYPTYVINETETRQWNGGMWRVFWTDDPAIVVFTFFQDRLRADGWETLQMPMPTRTASDERLNYGGGQDFSKPGFRLTVVAGPTEGERFRTQFRLLLEPEATPSATVPCPLGKDGLPLTRLQGQCGDFRPPSEVRAALSLAKLAALEAYIAFQNGTGTEAAYRAAEARFLELATQPDYNSPVFASPSDATPPEHTMYFSKQGFIEVSPFDDRNLSASETRSRTRRGAPSPPA
jgi:hypothetical protein